MPLAEELRQLDAASPLYATQFVDALLAASLEAGASDIHLRPSATGLIVDWRIDGVLQQLGEFPRGTAADIVSRLKVMAELLTYRTDIPQEGRIQPSRNSSSPSPPLARSKGQEGESGRVGEGERPAATTAMRLSTFPTLHGERAAIRIFGGEGQYLFIEDLGLPEEIAAALEKLLLETSGAILITGPAGSGKTTTAYACLREVIRTSRGRRGLVSLEDPIESALEGVSQSQIQPAAGFTLATGLRSLMRQDPEVILVGEIRDSETSQTVFQASLTGHLVISTFHAGSAAGALSRLLDMGIEPYLLTSGLRAVLHQRLVRKLCDCSQSITSTADILGLDISTARKATGCEACRQTGYRGRLALAEMLPPLIGDLSAAILGRRDSAELGRLARSAGMLPIFDSALAALVCSKTDPAEVRRVFGFM